ncbi:MAG: hypothetical protein ACOCXA_07410, partial [Planctomycetota bacterium]
DRDAARRCAWSLWHAGSGGPHRRWAGMLLVESLYQEQPIEARRIAFALLQQDDVPVDQGRRLVIRLSGLVAPEEARGMLRQAAARWGGSPELDAAENRLRDPDLVPAELPAERPRVTLADLLGQWSKMSDEAALRDMRRHLTRIQQPEARAQLLTAMLTLVPTARERDELQAALRELPVVADGVGEAWAALAQEATDGTASNAWMQAALHLPMDHAWRPKVVYSALRALDGRSPSEEFLRLAEQVAWSGADIVHLRCRYELAKLWLRQGRHEQARFVIEALRAHADDRQSALLERLQRRLQGDF